MNSNECKKWFSILKKYLDDLREVRENQGSGDYVEPNYHPKLPHQFSLFLTTNHGTHGLTVQQAQYVCFQQRHVLMDCFPFQENRKKPRALPEVEKIAVILFPPIFQP